MYKSPLLALFIVVLSLGIGHSQSLNDSSSQGAQSQGTQVDCSDPTQAGSAECNAAQTQRPAGGQGRDYSSPSERTPQLRTGPNANPSQNNPRTFPLNPSEIQRLKLPPRPETEFEQMVADSAGRALPLFGQSLFLQPPSTFAPIDLMQVPSDYIIGPGDELQIKIWGQVEADLRVIVDRSGQVYIPQVGQVSVAGIHYGDLEQHLKSAVSKIFRNFSLTVNVGRLRSIQVVVVGNARYPGTYTISSLSTLVNAIFASGGPAPQGSLRHIQVRRDGATITDFDFYDLLIKGDKSKDVRLLPGDVLYYPHVGPLVAISGSVNTPAIYEIKDNSTLSDLIEIAGDLSTVADTSKITIDRFVEHRARKTLEFPYDEQSRALALKDGDIVRVFSIISRFEDTVTLRGNVANPGRYPWKAGMRVRDLIPDAQALLTRRYWLDRAAITNGRATEYPVRTPPAPNFRCGVSRQSANGIPLNGNTQTGNTPPGGLSNGTTAPDLLDSTGNYNCPENLPGAVNSANSPDSEYAQNEQNSLDNDSLRSSDRAPLDNQQNSQMSGDTSVSPNRVRNVAEDLRRYAPEINWDYAIIQRVNPEDLSSKLLWLSPRKAILERDEQSNLELQPGDIVTIFSQRDISVPQTERSQYVIVEGEVVRPGVYKLATNETLHSVLQRAGGLTPNAYIYGSQMTRESAREEQQKSLDELVRNMEVQIRQSAMSMASSVQAADAAQLAQLQAAQEGIISQLRGTRASGRIALPVRPNDKRLTDFPNMVLEDSDRLVIPHTPSTVSVVGNVYNPGSFIFDPHNTSGSYLEMAGKGKPQSDLHHAFVLRANGVVVAANNVNGLFTGSKFDRLRLYPGDQIVVPYKLSSGAFVRGLRDWTQISSQLALTGAALAVIQ
ncbi:MAG: SLBB domain-containing protein [Terriglobales bacterium]|jgi:protein involved in polysaccharide export with SLBB domain